MSKYDRSDHLAVKLEIDHTREILFLFWELSQRQVDGLMNKEITPEIRKGFYGMKPNTLRQLARRIETEDNPDLVRQEGRKLLSSSVDPKIIHRLNRARKRMIKKKRKESRK